MKRIINTIAVILMVLGIIAGILAWKEEKPYRENRTEQKKLQREVILQGERKAPPERQIDFTKLGKINSDIAAWIYIPGTEIDYPVLIGRTDSEYLNKNYMGERSALGAVFGFSDTARDFTDAHICLFGHNMRTAQMFGELKRYKEKQFANAHQKLYCYTPEGVAEYQLFSIYECGKTDDTFKHKMQKDSMEFYGLFQAMQEKNMVVLELDNIIQTGNSQIITLSCCSEYQRTVNRMTVHFIKIDEATKICAKDKQTII